MLVNLSYTAVTPSPINFYNPRDEDESNDMFCVLWIGN